MMVTEKTGSEILIARKTDKDGRPMIVAGGWVTDEASEAALWNAVKDEAAKDEQADTKAAA
jgi:hypothetical protein